LLPTLSEFPLINNGYLISGILGIQSAIFKKFTTLVGLFKFGLFTAIHGA
jgi:hypothetical protein